jgi:hypothetical protein
MYTPAMVNAHVVNAHTRVQIAPLFALFLPFRVDFCFSKIRLNIKEHLKLIMEELAANGLLECNTEISV